MTFPATAILFAAVLSAQTGTGPASPEQRAASGLEALQAGRLKEAVEHLREAVRLAPRNPYYSMALGQAYLSSGQPKLAVPELERTLKLLPRDFDVRYALAQAYQNAEDDVSALRVLSGGLPAEPMTASWLFLRGFSLFRMSQFEQAAGVFVQLLAYPDMRAPAKFFLANCAFGRERLEEAVELYREAIRLGDRPDNKALNAYYHNCGLALFRLDRYGEAADAFRKSIERFSRDPLPHYFLARCQAASGRPGEAIATFEELLRQHPDFSPAYYQLAKLHSEHGDTARARELFQKVRTIKAEELRRAQAASWRLKVGAK